MQYGDNDIVRDKAHVYTLNPTVRGNHFSLGGTWTVGPEHATAGRDAKLSLNSTQRTRTWCWVGPGR